jgi:hypothetical protein
LVAKDLMLQKLLVSSIHIFHLPFSFAHIQRIGVGREHTEPPVQYKDFDYRGRMETRTL